MGNNIEDQYHIRDLLKKLANVFKFSLLFAALFNIPEVFSFLTNLVWYFLRYKYLCEAFIYLHITVISAYGVYDVFSTLS